MKSSIPNTKRSRGAVFAKAALKIGASSSKGAIKRAFMSKEQKEISQKETHQEIAKVIIDTLGTLKGVSVKIAQQVALGLPFLPQEYLDEISKSFNAIPPINKALIRKIIKQELGAYPQEIFDSFESEAFGAASLGQVHLAEKDGEKLAVKVQYPGIAKSIDSDMSVLKFALTRFAKGGRVDHLMDEVEARLKEEVDYELEAKQTEYFRTHLNNEAIMIAKIHPELSTKKVLVSSFLAGDDFQTFVASNPTKEQRDHYAQLIFDSFFIGLYKLRMIHADPNPGNFIFMEDAKLGIIDFGCVKQINTDFLASFSKLHVSLMDGVADEEIVAQYCALKMIDEDTPEKMLAFYQDVIKPLDRIYIEIFEEDSYDFQVHSDFSKRGFETIMQVQKNNAISVHNMNEEYIFVDRTLLGYYAMFEQMQATIDTRFAKSLVRGGLS